MALAKGPMRFLRLLICAGIAIALFVQVAPSVAARYSGGKTDMMPTASGVVTPGHYAEVHSRRLAAPVPSEYAYAPSKDIQALAQKHMNFSGLIPKTWFEFIPSSARENAPVVILLHGAGRDGLSVLDMWKETAVQNGLVLVAPNAGQDGWPLANPDPKFLGQIVSEVSKLHPIDPDKIFLFGHSNGAIYAQILLNRTQGPWRAAALHAGFAPARALIAPATAKPIKLYLGDEDHIFSMAAARESGKASAARGHDFDLMQIQGHNHWFYVAGPKIAADSWAWMAAITAPELTSPVTN